MKKSIQAACNNKRKVSDIVNDRKVTVKMYKDWIIWRFARTNSIVLSQSFQKIEKSEQK